MVASHVGCGSDEIDNSTPKAAYESYRSAVHAGDWDKVYQLLTPDLKEKIAGTLELNRRTIRLINDNIPAGLRANYLEEIGSAAMREATTPAAYFGATLPDARKAPSSMGSTVSTRSAGITEVPRGSNKWVVRTLGGERISIHGATDGLYYVVPDKADSDRINLELNKAGVRLVVQQRIGENLARGVTSGQ